MRNMRILLGLLTIFSLIISPSQVFAHSQTQIIKMTDSGFDPQQASLDISSTLMFINQDTKAHWPASDVHPTHEIYPEFDPKRPINPNESWQFKPKRTGSFKFHDHLFPHFRGSMEVLGENISAPKIEQKSNLITVWFNQVKNFFQNLASKIPWFKKTENKVLGVGDISTLTPTEQIEAIKNMAEKDGAQNSWQYLKTTFKGTNGASGNIHDLAHLAGSLIFDQKGFAGLSLCSADFAFGCYHGFLDKAFAQNLDHLIDAQNACLTLGTENSGPVASCIHGIGHGVASFYATVNLQIALSACKKLTSGKDFCFDGVLMEFVRSAPTNFFKKEDPYFPCDDLENQFGGLYSVACGRNQPPLLMSRFNMSFDEVVGVCTNNILSKDFQMACVNALGFSLAPSGDVGKIVSGCEKMLQPELIASCAKSAAGELVFQEIPGWETGSEEICRRISFGGNECKIYVDQIIKEYNRKKKINLDFKQDNENENSYIKRQLKVCFDLQGSDNCYKSAAQILYDQFGLAKTLNLLKNNEEAPEVYARCHEVTHYLSRLEYQKLGNIAKVYSQCDSTCHGGCYHGTLEAYLKEQQSQPNFNLAQHFPTICGNKQDYQKPLEFYECLHGLGHAAMFVTEMELKQSLTLCDTLENQMYKEKCYSGVFMENSSSSTSDDHASIYIKKDDPFYPCNSLEDQYQPLCWQYQSSYFSIISNQDFSKVADLCQKIPDQYQQRCFLTIGTNQVGFTRSMEVMKQNCDKMPSSNFQNICVAGVISSLSYRFVGDTNKMIEFCAIVNTENKESCYKQMGTSLLDWDQNKEQALNECKKIPASLNSAICMSAI